MTKTSTEILKFLQSSNGRKSKDQIVRHLPYTDDTVRGRLSELTAAGYVNGSTAAGIPYRLTAAGIRYLNG